MLYHRGVSPSCREGLSCYTTEVCPLRVERVYRAIPQSSTCVPFMILECCYYGDMMVHYVVINLPSFSIIPYE